MTSWDKTVGGAGGVSSLVFVSFVAPNICRTGADYKQLLGYGISTGRRAETMAIRNCNTELVFRNRFFPSYPLVKFPPNATTISFISWKRISTWTSLCSRKTCNEAENGGDIEANQSKKKISEQSSWEAKDAEGRDYLYRLGKEADNMNISVGARAGIIDDLFVGNFLGRDCNYYCLVFIN